MKLALEPSDDWARQLKETGNHGRGGYHLMEMDTVEFREQNDALLLIWIGPRNKRHAALGCTQIVRQMRYAGRNVDKIPGLGVEVFFQSFAIPHAGLAA